MLDPQLTAGVVAHTQNKSEAKNKIRLGLVGVWEGSCSGINWRLRLLSNYILVFGSHWSRDSQQLMRGVNG